MQTPHVNTGDTGTAAWADALRDDASGSAILHAHQQTTAAMTLFVEDGAYYINGARYLFAGGSTPTFTAPVSNPRIDLVTIDTTGTLTIVEGTEAASPAVPSYPENVVTLCEVYHVVGETAIYTSDSSNYGWTSSQGYIQNDVRPIVGYGPNFGAIGEDLDPDTTNTRSLGSSAKQWKNIYGENLYNNGALVAATKFGGTGADGALSISSGTTTIDLGGASYFEKNYSSISITGTGALAFSNPSTNGCVVVLKCSGNCTITSTAAPAIDLRSIGAAAGNYGVGLIKGPDAPFNPSGSYYSGGNNLWASGSNGGGGVHIATSSPASGLNVFAGAGAAAGNSFGGNTSGAGGAGGGGLYIQCAGYLDFTADIKCDGGGGTNGSGSATIGAYIIPGGGGGGNADGTSGSMGYATSSGASGGAGGGGGGGSCVILYNFLTANTGTITVTGGSGGTSNGTGGKGGDGFSYVGLNTYFS